MTEPVCPPDCGKCCDPVVSIIAPNEIPLLSPRMTDDQLTDRQFMHDHLTPLPRREGLRRAPYLTDNGHTLMLARDNLGGGLHVIEAWSHFYTPGAPTPVKVLPPKAKRRRR